MKDFQGFDANQDAEALYNAMKGFGMDAPPDCPWGTPGVPFSWVSLAWLGVLHPFPSQLTDSPGFLSSLEPAWLCLSSQPQLQSSSGHSRLAVVTPGSPHRQ